jgi:transcription elongation factor Elf1
MVEMFRMQIGDCPKCGKRTFVVILHRKTVGFNFKGHCYDCEARKEFDF